MHAHINGFEMHWREAGRGAVVLFIHGFPLSARMWERQLERIPEGWRGIAPDLRGFGESAGGADALSIDGFADDIAALLDTLDIERAVVCGLSMGGYVAFALWRRRPELFRGLILCDTRAEADPDEARENRRRLAERVQEEGSDAAVDAMLPKLLAGPTFETRPDVVERVREMIDATSTTTLAAALGALATRPDSTPDLGGISVPTLVIAGAEDAITGPETARGLAGAMPDARARIIPDAGHLPNLENPDAFDDAVAAFLRELDTAGS